jgi:hypothetical protein
MASLNKEAMRTDVFLAVDRYSFGKERNVGARLDLPKMGGRIEQPGSRMCGDVFYRMVVRLAGNRGIH